MNFKPLQIILNRASGLSFEIDDHYYQHLLARTRGELGQELAEAALIEFLKFFFIATRNPEKRIFISSAIDHVWHEAILETKAYRRLNDIHNTGSFLDHSGSEIFQDRESSSFDFHANFEFVINYFHLFGEFKEENLPLWPQASAICKSKHLNVIQFNFLINQISASISKAVS